MAPGRIQHGGPGAFAVGELDGELSPRAKELADLLGAVTPTQVTENILGYKWAKHVYSALLVATALVDAHVYEVVERSPEIQRMLVVLVAEGMAVAEAEGVRLEPFDEFDPALYRAGAAGDEGAVARAMAAIAKPLPRQHEDEDRHLAGPRRAEAEDRGGGAPRRDGREGGAPRAPDTVTRRLMALIGDLESGRRAMDWANLDELVREAVSHGTHAVTRRGVPLATDPTSTLLALPGSAGGELQPAVSGETLMEHVRTIGAWERESGSPGEAQAYDYIERTLRTYGSRSSGARSRPSSACPSRAASSCPAARSSRG